MTLEQGGATPNDTRVRRIMILVSFANLGGAQIAALRLARGFRDRGYEPSVHFFYQQSPVNTPDHPYEVLLASDRPGLAGYVRIARRLVAVMRRERPDVVVTFLPFANVVGQAAAALCGVKRRVASHRFVVRANTVRPVFHVLDTIFAWTGIYTGVVAVSKAVLESVQHYPARLLRRAMVIHNGVRGWAPSKLSQCDARARLGVPRDTTVLVAVGRLAPQKNYRVMLDIMKRLEDAVLLVAGDGPLRPDLERWITEAGLGAKVRLLGSVSREDIPDVLAAADLFIQTSTFEGQSNSVLEALQAGLPLIVHDIPEQRETVADLNGQFAGALVPLNDVDAWVAAIEEFRRNPARREEACSVSRRRSATFTYETMMDKFEQAIVA